MRTKEDIKGEFERELKRIEGLDSDAYNNLLSLLDLAFDYK